MNRLGINALVLLTLSGCINAPPRVTPQPPATPSDETRATPGAVAPDTVSASAVLLEQARAQHDTGDYADATSTIERALRIDPNNPELWIALGEIKYDEGDRQQADLMARKALTLAAGDRSVQFRANRLISR